MRVFCLLLLLSAFASSNVATAETPEEATSEAVTKCQSWIDTDEAIDSPSDWVHLASEKSDDGTDAVFINLRFQMHILASDIAKQPTGQLAAEVVRVRICELQPTRRRGLAADSSLFWRFATVDFGGRWQDFERIDYPVATRAVKQLIPDYAENPEYLPGEGRYGVEEVGIGFAFCNCSHVGTTLPSKVQQMLYLLIKIRKNVQKSTRIRH